MDREEIIRMAREAGFTEGDISLFPDLIAHFAALVVAEKEKQIIAANAPEIERINTYIKELEEAVAAEREAFQELNDVATIGMQHARADEREACAKVCDVLAVHPEYASDITKVAAQAIRART
jgi:Asp-tRNA(Asn)/Glu-tRNA(Gln) amidotransferase C subunit